MKKYGIKGANFRFSPRPEIFPSEKAPVLISLENKELIDMKWGFSPPFTKRLIINARSETVDKKPTFKKAFLKQRCLIPASGFFEWKNENNKKVKYNIYLDNKSLFSFAGIYDSFSDTEGNSYLAFTILTTDASSKIEPIHNRMPVILDNKDENLWLRKDFEDIHKLKNILHPYEKDNLVIDEQNNQQLKFDF